MSTTDHPVETTRPEGYSPAIRLLLLASVSLIFFSIVSGGVMRLAQLDSACPGCLGVGLPPLDASPWIIYLPWVGNLLCAALVAFAVWAVRGRKLNKRLVVAPLMASLGLIAFQIMFGKVLSPLEVPWTMMLHLGLSLAILGLLLTATIVVFVQGSRPDGLPKLTYRAPFARLSLLALAVVFLLMVSGAVVAANSGDAVCAGWPICSGSVAQWGAESWLQMSHRIMVLLSAVMLGWLFVQSWRTQRSQTPVIVSSTAAAVLFVAQALLGSRMGGDAPLYLLALHQATAVAVWGTLVVLVVCVGIARREAEEERQETAQLRGRRGLWRDLLLLTKPIVVLLLLVTTYAGMVIAAADWPSPWLTLWTLLGGFLAAGGSGAINQYIDRSDDLKMQRTQKRPLPAGRLTPGEGLAFGVGIALASFYLMTAFVNFLAALLTLAGILYYVLIYSIFLKKTTVQNIVIGGGAGAIPPLVGWAAATGALNLPSLFLFALVFLWTPPHFWALALVRRNDYARAGVPMLPVVRGERETRWQIFLYTIELVALTLLLPLFGLGGSMYFVGAAMLGGWLLLAAWKVWKQGGNKVAWKMYRFSSMYLAFIFVVLMADALI